MLAGAVMAEPTVKRPYDSLLQAANAHARAMAATTSGQTPQPPAALAVSSPDEGAGVSRGRRKKREGKA
jgi:hypothetical protein